MASLVYHQNQGVQDALERWTPAQWDYTFRNLGRSQAYQVIQEIHGGKVYSVRALRRIWLQMFVEGWEYVPLGRCDHYSRQQGCLGHLI